MSWLQRNLLEDSPDDLCTIGSLLDMHQNYGEPLVARKLDSWNARTDQLGSLLNLAVTLV